MFSNDMRLRMSRFPLNHGKRGFSSWRYCFTACENAGSEETAFIIELNSVNPLLSSEKCIFGLVRQSFSSKENLDNEENERKEILDTEILTEPSYVAVRLVVLGKDAKEFASFVPYKDVEIDKKGISLNVSSCHFSLSRLKGKLFCKDGNRAEWDLKYEIESYQDRGFKGKNEEWTPLGVSSVFTGTLRVNDKSYIVQQGRSFGYIDQCSGRAFSENYFHLSSSNLISMIARKSLPLSFFVAHGIYNGKLSFLSDIEGRKLKFFAHRFFDRYTTTQECVPMPNSEHDNRVHWTMSLHNSTYVIDVDVFCKESDMFMRVLEDVQDGKRVRKIFSSQFGSGELKIYRSIKCSLELLDHVKIDRSLCEYGRIESVS